MVKKNHLIPVTLGQLVSEWGQNLNEVRNRDEAVTLAVKHSERLPEYVYRKLFTFADKIFITYKIFQSSMIIINIRWYVFNKFPLHITVEDA